MSHIITSFLQKNCIINLATDVARCRGIRNAQRRDTLCESRSDERSANTISCKHDGAPSSPSQKRPHEYIPMWSYLHFFIRQFCCPSKTVNISHRYNTNSACTCGSYSQLQALPIIVPIQLNTLNIYLHDYSLFSNFDRL